MAQDKETPIPVCRKIRKPGKRVFQRFPGNGGGGAGRQSVSGQPGAGMPGEKGRPAAYWRRICALESACENTREEDARDVPGIAIASQKPGLRTFGGEGEAGALHIFALLTAGDEYLADGNAVFVEDEEPSLPVHGHIQIAVGVSTHGIRGRTDEVVGDGRAHGEARHGIGELNPVQEAARVFRNPEGLPVRTQGNTVGLGEVPHDRCNRREIRADVEHAAGRICGGAPEVGEIKAALCVKDHVIGNIASYGGDDFLQIVSVRINGQDSAAAPAVWLRKYRGDEDAAVFVQGKAGRRETFEFHDNGKFFVRREPHDAVPRDVAENETAFCIDDGALKHAASAGNLEPGLCRNGGERIFCPGDGDGLLHPGFIMQGGGRLFCGSGRYRGNARNRQGEGAENK